MGKGVFLFLDEIFEEKSELFTWHRSKDEGAIDNELYERLVRRYSWLRNEQQMKHKQCAVKYFVDYYSVFEYNVKRDIIV